QLAGEQPSEEAALPPKLGEVQGVVFSPTEPCVFTALAAKGGLIWRWDWGERDIRRALTVAPSDPLTASVLAVSADGKQLAAGGSDGRIGIWDTATDDPRAQAVLTGHSGPVRLVQFVPPEGRLMSIGDGGEVILWDVATKFKLREWAFDKGLVGSFALSPDGRL